MLLVCFLKFQQVSDLEKYQMPAYICDQKKLYSFYNHSKIPMICKLVDCLEKFF